MKKIKRKNLWKLVTKQKNNILNRQLNMNDLDFDVKSIHDWALLGGKNKIIRQVILLAGITDDDGNTMSDLDDIFMMPTTKKVMRILVRNGFSI